MRKKKISSKELEKKFDEGKEDVLEYFEVASRRVNIDLPVPMVEVIDKEAKRIGVARQALIKMWIAAKVDGLKSA